LAAYDIGGPQLHDSVPRAISWSRFGCFTTSARGLHVVEPDRIDCATGEHETWPAGDAVAPRERELRVGKLRSGLLALHVAQQILRLMLELIEIRMDGKMTLGPDGPPSKYARCPPRSGKGGS
jgi:hypothetical protein